MVYIGTLPSARGKGYSRKLVDYVTDIADNQGMPCYLESSGDISSKVYQRFGFCKMREIVLVRGKERFEMDIMIREPIYEKKKG